MSTNGKPSIDAEPPVTGKGSADLVLTGGKVVTLDPNGRIATAVAIQGDRIMAVGSDGEIAAGEGARHIDLAGRTVIPGLMDGHAHLDREGLKDRLPSLAGAESIDHILQIIEDRVRRTPPGEWIVTMPIGDPPSYLDVPGCLAEGRCPNRHDLDRISPDHPVFIRPIWGHWRGSFPIASVANSRALEAAGITRRTVAPTPSVEIECDGDGEPTGIFFENSYKPIVEHTLMSVIPGFGHEDRLTGLRQSMRAYNSHGTTSVFEGHGINSEVLAAYRALRDDGPLAVRAHLLFSPSWKSHNRDDVAAMLADWSGWLGGRGLGDEFLRMGGLFTEPVKDGENSLRVATFPYAGWAGFNFDCELPQEVMIEMMIEAARNNIRVAATGTRMLAAFEQVNRTVPIDDQRWVMGHVGLMDGDEIRRIRDCGLCLTTYTHRYIHDQGEQLRAELGEAGASNIAPLRSLIDAGIHVSLATDNVPVSLFEPIWHVVARIPRGSDRALAPEQALTREEALACASREGAWLTFEEDCKGTIAPGRFADLAVLSADPLSVPEDELRSITADLTITAGRVVYDRQADGAVLPGGSRRTRN